MKNKIINKMLKITLITFCFFFFKKIDVFAIDFTCVYKLNNDVISLSITDEIGVGNDYPSYSISINNSDTVKFYPANFIANTNGNYERIPGARYYSGNSDVYACPSSLSAAISNNIILEKKVRFDLDSHIMPLIFFSDSGYQIVDNNLTSNVVSFTNPDDIDSNGLSKNDFTLKEYLLSKTDSKPGEVIVPPTTDDNTQYCYYKNSCGAVIELTFYKRITFKVSTFNNGKKLMDWEKDTCPTSIQIESERYVGKNTACTGTGSVTNCYSFMNSYSTKQSLITNGNCEGKSDDANESSIKYLSLSSNKIIGVEYVNSNVSSEKFIITDNDDMFNVSTKTVTNPEEFESYFRNKDSDNYPVYLLKNDNEYTFTNSKSDANSGDYQVFILSSKIHDVLGIKEGSDNLEETCQNLFGSTFLKFLNNNILKIVYIAIPIILILLTSFDFAKVVFVDDKEGIQAAFKKFGKRIVAAVLIYLIPTILIFVTNIFANDEVSQCVQALKNISESE